MLGSAGSVKNDLKKKQKIIKEFYYGEQYY